jgi:hypothetical protein
MEGRRFQPRNERSRFQSVWSAVPVSILSVCCFLHQTPNTEYSEYYAIYCILLTAFVIFARGCFCRVEVLLYTGLVKIMLTLKL